MTDAEESADRGRLDDESKQQAQERAEEIDRMYEPGVRPTTVVPGTNGMVSGTAFADMADDRPNDERADAGNDDADASRERASD